MLTSKNQQQAIIALRTEELFAVKIIGPAARLMDLPTLRHRYLVLIDSYHIAEEDDTGIHGIIFIL